LKVRELIDGLASGEIVEEYPEYPKGHSILLLQNAKIISRFILSGGYRQVIRSLQSLLQHIVLILKNGTGPLKGEYDQ
jgi:hypothetical protein